MSDIVERLRHKSAVVPSDNTLCDEAADEIESLRSRLAEAETVLREARETIYVLAEQQAMAEFVWVRVDVVGAEIESLRSRLADLEAERTLIVQRAENAERALVENEARLAEAADEIERLRVKADTLQFLVNQRDIDIEGYKARLADAEALSPAGSRA